MPDAATCLAVLGAGDAVEGRGGVDAGVLRRAQRERAAHAEADGSHLGEAVGGSGAAQELAHVTTGRLAHRPVHSKSRLPLALQGCCAAPLNKGLPPDCWRTLGAPSLRRNCTACLISSTAVGQSLRAASAGWKASGGGAGG